MYTINDITVNGVSYDWRMLSFSFVDENKNVFLIPNGVTSLTYNQTRESQWNFGVGGRAISKGFGNTTATATMTMAAYELQNVKEQMTRAAEDKGVYVQNIPMFDIKVQYNFDDGSTKIDTIRQCSFNTDGGGASQNDMFIQTEINLDPSSIEFGQVTKA